MTIIRIATEKDTQLILSFIQQKSEFDRSIGAYSGQLQTNADKVRATLFSVHPFAYVLIAEASSETLSSAVGFALYAFRYSSFIGQPSIWLDDLYVHLLSRNQGVGTMLMNRLAQISLETKCTHIAWNADARNHRGVKFYQRLGATINQQHGNRLTLEWQPATPS